MKHPVGHTRNDIAVHVDLIQSAAGHYAARQPHVLTLVAEALRHKSVHGANVVIEHDMGRPIGYSFVIPTSDTDAVFYARLVHDETYTRFIRSGTPLSTPYLTMVLQRTDDGSYELQDTWIGRLTPSRPGTTGENDESRPYWESHAYILGNQVVQVSTVTKVCPY